MSFVILCLIFIAYCCAVSINFVLLHKTRWTFYALSFETWLIFECCLLCIAFPKQRHTNASPASVWQNFSWSFHSFTIYTRHFWLGRFCYHPIFSVPPNASINDKGECHLLSALRGTWNQVLFPSHFSQRRFVPPIEHRANKFYLLAYSAHLCAYNHYIPVRKAVIHYGMLF